MSERLDDLLSGATAHDHHAELEHCVFHGLVAEVRALEAEVERERKRAYNNYTTGEVLRADLARKDEALRAVEALIAESRGVIGLHLNGDEAAWESLRTGGRLEEWLLAFDAALTPAPPPASGEGAEERRWYLRDEFTPGSTVRGPFRCSHAAGAVRTELEARYPDKDWNLQIVYEDGPLEGR